MKKVLLGAIVAGGVLFGLRACARHCQSRTSEQREAGGQGCSCA